MADSAIDFRSMLRPTEAGPEPETDSGLPSLSDGQYQPYARAANKPLYSIHFVTTKGEVRSFQYVHLDSNSNFTAECITLRFMGMEPVKVLIHGRNLWRLYDYIHQHRTNWVLEAPRDFAQDGQPVVTRVSYAAIEEVE